MFKILIFVVIAFVVYFFVKEYLSKSFSSKNLLLTDGNKTVIPVFFATDDNYVPYACTAIYSLLDNGSKSYQYKIYILTSQLKDENVTVFKSIENIYSNVTVDIVNVKSELDKLSDMLSMRDYYSNATYNRLFIARLFPEYDKVLYLDSDIVVKGDISKLYNEDVSNYMVAAVQDEIVSQTPLFVEYVENVLGIKAENYFNAGILLINTKAFREECIEQKFVSLLKIYRFKVDQDQGYLNVLCKDRVKYVELGWNKGAYVSEGIEEKDINIIHYKMQWRPWHYKNVAYEEYFWKYAKQTPFYDYIKNVLDTYSEEQKLNDAAGAQKLLDMCYEEVRKTDNFMAIMNEYKMKKIKNSLSEIFDDKAMENLFNFLK